MSKLILFLTFLLSSVFVYSQITFERTYGGIADDLSLSVVQASDGGYIITGWTASYGAGNTDVYLIRTDNNGDTLWSRTYGGVADDMGVNVIQTHDSGYIIIGITYSFGAGYWDLYLIKTNANGDSLWTKTFGWFFYDAGADVSQTSDGGYIITGEIAIDTCLSSVYLIKTNDNGDLLWSKTYGGFEYDRGLSVIQTDNGGFIVAGFTSSFGAGGGDVYLIRTDSNGDSLWTNTFGGIYYDEGYSIVQTTDGGYIIAGTTYSFGAGGGDVYLIKLDVNGDSLWTKTYGGIYRDLGSSVSQTSDGGYIVTGYTESFGAYPGNVFLIRTDNEGDTIWTKTFGGQNSDEGRSVMQTIDGGYIITGGTDSFGAGYYDVYLIKTDENGIVGIPKQSITSNNIVIYPNPTSGIINIKTSQIFGRIKTLEVYDYLGQLQLSRTSNFEDIDISSLPGGLFFIVLTNKENERYSSRMIKE